MNNTDSNYEIGTLLNKLKKHFGKTEHPDQITLEVLTQLGQTLLNPLAAILGMAQTLQQQTLTPEQQKDYIAHIHQISSEMLTLVNQCIDYSRMTQEQTKGFTSIASHSEIIYTELQGIHTLLIDDDILRRDTTLKHLQTLGLQCAVTGSETALQMLYDAQQGENPYQITIISANHFDHHIAYFGRTIKTNPKLAQVMPVLALATDVPDYEKERAHFSGFNCVINLLKTHRLGSKLANAWDCWSTKMNFRHPAVSVTKNLVLLVEDDPIPQKVTQRQLAELGFTVDTATNGQTALKFLEQKVYDLVFMDIGLPDISGLEVTSQFRKQENGTLHTPVIGLTMHALGSDQEIGLQAGMDEYIVKPLLQDRLKEVLKKWVPNKNTQTSNSNDQHIHSS